MKGLENMPWRKSNETGIFQVDEHGYISPVHAPDLVFGVVREVNYTFQPKNPYWACRPCHSIAGEMADKTQCHGSTSVSALPGYMLRHVTGERTLDVHRCPNRMACLVDVLVAISASPAPASYLVRASFAPKVRKDEYQRSEPLEMLGSRPPVVAKAMKAAALVAFAVRLITVGRAVVSNGLFYAFALNSAKPRTDTQQIFKVFLAFLTISCRSLSALPKTRHYAKLTNDIKAAGEALYQSLFAVDLVISSEPGSMNFAYDCWGLTEEGPALVVWGNMFVPPLIAAAARLAKGPRILMYEAAFGTRCVENLWPLLNLPRFWLAAGTTLLLLLVGPVLWLMLAAKDPAKEVWDQRSETVAFLVAGYRPTLRWWEVMVLGRKAAIFAVSALLPMSLAPASHLIYLLGIVVVAELLHVTIRPHASNLWHRLEARMLGISSVCLVLVMSLLVEWPFMPYAIYVASSALFFALTSGVYIYFLWLYIRSSVFKSPNLGEEDREGEEG
ncbi:pmp10 [Symbiodinium necroappetens]|uniref:Pmp10 protein n=1 Tax=Symbiodinium necroappetens TaxID=1628268 RepID=A0A812QRE8_9DINO|nr:pmp10 [Symbiodinium necroappetens]